MRIYYLGDPDIRVETIPAGLQMVGGDKTATTAGDTPTSIGTAARRAM
jgi:hypothetical protein